MVTCGLHDTVMLWYSTIPENFPPLWMEPPQWLTLLCNLLLLASQVESVSSALLYWMPALTRRARIQSEAMAAEFKASFLSCLEDSEVAQRMQLIFDPTFKSYPDPLTGKMADTIKMLSQTVNALKKDCADKDNVIRQLNQDVIQLQSHVNDLEQHGRRDSVRMFGLSEVTPGSPDQKVLRLCNQRMQLNPPLQIDEIAVSHRVGKINPPADDGSPGASRPLLVKFATRRSKNRVMEVLKKLKVTDQQLEDPTDGRRGRTSWWSAHLHRRWSYQSQGQLSLQSQTSQEK